MTKGWLLKLKLKMNQGKQYNIVKIKITDKAQDMSNRLGVVIKNYWVFSIGSLISSITGCILFSSKMGKIIVNRKPNGLQLIGVG